MNRGVFGCKCSNKQFMRLDAKMWRSIKLISIFGIAVGLGVWVTVLIVRFASLFECGRDEIDRKSADGRTIIIERVNCGATTAYATHVSISEDREATGVHRVAGFSNPGTVSAFWDGKNKIMINYDKALEVFQKDEKYSDIAITYTPIAHTP